MNISLDFSQKTELKPLAQVVSAPQSVAQPAGIDFFLMGAAARDLMLRHAHNIEPSRKTEDVDFAVMLRDWKAFATLLAALIASGEFHERPGPATHRLCHRSGLPLDIVPFGGIERADRTITWPPDQSTVFDCFGAREAFEASIWGRVGGTHFFGWGYRAFNGPCHSSHQGRRSALQARRQQRPVSSAAAERIAPVAPQIPVRRQGKIARLRAVPRGELQITFAVRGFVEDPVATHDRLRPFRIRPLIAGRP